jgi:nucleoredoxin
MVTITPLDENNDDVFSIESLIGPNLLKAVKGTPVATEKEALKSNTTGIIALYFSASWCPPCQRFTPILTEFYKTAKKSKLGFEIVYVSSDRSIEEFEEYYGKMPWLAIPSKEGSAQIKTKLAESLGVSGIPALAVIDTKTGEFISGGEARDAVMDAGGDMKEVIATIAKWKVAKRHPMWDAPRMMDKGANSRSFIGKVLSFMARNPMIIFGLIYLYKWVQKQMNDGGDNSPPEVEAAPVVEDSEF